MADREYYDVVIPNVRVVNPHLTTPGQAKIPGTGKLAAPQYKTTFIVPKTDTTTLQGAMEALQAEFKQVFPTGDQAMFNAALANIFTDGDAVDAAEVAAGKPSREWRKGMIVGKCSSDADHKPPVFDTNQQPLLDGGAIYSGCYCHLQVLARAGVSPSNGQPYVKFYISQVMKAGDGDRIGGGGANPSVFAGLTGGGTSAANPLGGLPPAVAALL